MSAPWPPEIVDALYDCPTHALRWAAAAYRAGVSDGRAEIMWKISDAGREVARAARPLLRAPTWAELEERRNSQDHRPCAIACGRCARCVHADAFARRGGRPYLGQQREAELARSAS